jgi:hypothetical protein
MAQITKNEPEKRKRLGRQRKQTLGFVIEMKKSKKHCVLHYL